ncbi:hypothetical protein Ancab_016242 [Ancistrocladus abbreviatus]
MAAETVNPSHPSQEAEVTSGKQLDEEVREMISALNNRLANLGGIHKPSSSSSKHQDADENGVRVITLAGSNNGATMRREVDDGATPVEDDEQGVCVNSNSQAVNNSIMLGGSYTSNDPGVQVEISDVLPPQAQQTDKREKAWRKKRENRAAATESKQHYSN